MIRNENVKTMVSKAAKIFANTNAPLSSIIDFHSHGDDIKLTLFGFNSNRTGSIIEVIVNNVMIDKVVVIKDGARHCLKHKVNFEYIYKLKTGTQHKAA